MTRARAGQKANCFRAEPNRETRDPARSQRVRHPGALFLKATVVCGPGPATGFQLLRGP
jgi:hypothetical protein